MIDFFNINAFEKGRRDSFESLICILAKREPQKAPSEFQANDGRGGDGGVEALWIKFNGEKIGYQAKYFETLGDSQWRQMDESVEQALLTHPQLVHYVFALPFDLTPDRGPKATGKSQREKWTDRVVKWKKLAVKESITVDFELWGATELTEKILRNENSSIHEHWFGADLLDDEWFQRQIGFSTQKLDDRFNPEDHVDISLEQLFDTIVRGPAVRSKLCETFESIAINQIPTFEFSTIEVIPDADWLLSANQKWDELLAFQKVIDAPHSADWNWDSAREILSQLLDAVGNLEHPLYSINRKDFDDKGRNEFEALLKSFRDLSAALDALDSLLGERNLSAESMRTALVVGEAGSGKSHCFAQVANDRISDRFPTILLLGQDFSNAPFWEQLGGLLGLKGKTAPKILGSLNAAGERKNERTLLLFDAINEGIGASYWRHWAPEFIEALKPYRYLAAVFSCRDAYLPYALPEALLKNLPQSKIYGFSTPKERERAAIQYLDKKGISRPNTTWLSPEFSNPLFLKTTSESLREKGQTEFPRGLNGVSQLMALYLDALSSRTGVTNVQGDDVSGALKKFVRAVAWEMANEGKDYVSWNRADDIATHHLRGRTPPVGGSWLNVFIGSNLLRRDPPPFSKSIDPLDPPSDLVRFAYQRFQDFLMADALVDRVIDNRKYGIAALASRVCYKVFDVFRDIFGSQKIDRGASEFQRSGPLNFLFYHSNSDNELRYEYSGLVAALSTIYPEKLGLEFAPALPDWKKRWEHDQPVQLGFADSFKWRNTEAFTDCTRDLFNGLQEHPVDKLGLLLEVSMTAEHPWNAERLHRHLKPLELAQRDSNWTRWINWSSREEYSQIERIVTWALSSLGRATDARHLELASLVLGWSLSSTHVILRDRATKALTKVFLKRSNTFNYLLDKLQNCNDPYVIERLYAAAFGACCIDPNHARLKAYSTLVFSSVFADGKPPVGLMARDYALGVIELADHYSQLDTSINVSGCYHPFNSEAPEFGLTMVDLKQIAKESGGERILSSASSEVGDYGKYSIPGRIRSFLATPLGHTLPKSKDQIKQSCYDELIAPYPDRLAALEAYETAPSFPVWLNFDINDADALVEDAEQKQTENEETRGKLREALEAMYGEEDIKRLGAEYFQDGLSHDAYEHVSIQQCRWWITKRAYELGWTARLFPNDGHSAGYSRYENDLERIGKKYQRIALDEMEARLADNFWYLEWADSSPKIYKYSHHDFRRNIEPTLLPDNPCLQIKQDDTDAWMIQPQIDLPEVTEDDLNDWPFLQDPSCNADEKLVRQGPDGSQWLVLYDHVHARENYSSLRQSDHSARIEEFRFFHCVFVAKGKGRILANSLKKKNEIDSWTFKPSEYVDGPYLGEAFWRDTWERSMFSEETLQMGDKCSVAIPLASYQWESHLDRTLRNGFSIYLPQRWFAEGIDLKGHSDDYKTWCNQANEDIIKIYKSGEDHQLAVVVERTALLNYLADTELEAVWLFIAERNVWPGGNNSQARWRRSESAIWYDGLKWHRENWFHDTHNS